MPKVFKGMVVGELAVVSHAYNYDVPSMLREEARRVEREQEETLVKQLVTRAKKD